MEKFNSHEESLPESQTEVVPSFHEKLKTTNKVLQKLLLWGFISLSPVVATQLRAQEINLTNPKSAQIFENEFEKQGLVNPEAKKEKPVIAVMSRDSEEGGQQHNLVSIYTQEVLSNSDNIDVVDRDLYVIREILKEAMLVEEGLVEQENSFKLGQFVAADYYVLSSTDNIDGVYILKNQVIDLETGETKIASVESKKEYSESLIEELAEKTEKIIGEMQLNKNGEEK